MGPAQGHPEEIARGVAFRLPARWTYEEAVEFMPAELPPGAARRTGLLVTTGYKAGLWVMSPPDEAYVSRGPGRCPPHGRATTGRPTCTRRATPRGFRSVPAPRRRGGTHGRERSTGACPAGTLPG
ncbi:Imm45 family immunity protein [Streptomyces sp. NPDC045714]|uniref:Imm45 family immunity protein n=1 Tax=Streptomyces sp. NPDC045714 TaxID=3154913 RepID=UPI0033FFD30A